MGWNSHLSILLCLLIAIALERQGFWIAQARIPLYVTLSGMLVFRGLTLIVLNGKTLAPSQDYLAYSTEYSDLSRNGSSLAYATYSTL